MCEPVSIAMGVGQAASAIGGYQSQVAQTEARNNQLAANYNQRRVAYEKGNLDRIAGYGAKVIDTDLAIDEAGFAASRAQSKVQTEEDNLIRVLEQKDQNLELKGLVGTGKASEGGRSRTYGKNVELARGRARGAIEAQKDALRVRGFAQRREVVERANQARRKAYRGIAMGPGEAGPAPEMPKFLKGPSKLALGIQLAGAAVTAAAPMFKAKPPGFDPGTAAPPGISLTSPIPDMGYNVQLQSGFVPSTGSFT